MPSPRAVLADVTKYRLDPKKAYSTTHANGHLAKLVNVPGVSVEVAGMKEVQSEAVEQVSVETFVESVDSMTVEEQPAQLSPVEPDVVAVEEPVTDEVVEDVPEEIEQQVSRQEQTTVVAKKQKKQKKVS
jgi:hypothetical protein